MSQGRGTAALPGAPGGDDWITALLLTAAFAVLWWMYRRRARRDGAGRPAGFARPPCSGSS